MTRLQPINLQDFTGGLNLRSTGFQLAPNESPGMLNVHVDSRGGFSTRRGWRRWNPKNITSDTWAPRNAFSHTCLTDRFSVFVSNENMVYKSGSDAEFVDLEVACNARTHLVDFVGWGDYTYMATGRDVGDVDGAPARCDPAGNVSFLTPAGPLTWNNDYTVPEEGVFPLADVAEPHAGYMFVASTREGGSGKEDEHPSRLRWSHPLDPEDWAEEDYIDILMGGGFITALCSFEDHLLIFKDESVWALYGYDRDSWQLVRVSDALGTSSPTSIARSPSAVYFYSDSGGGGIFGYSSGGAPVKISESLDGVIESIDRPTDVWLGWGDNKLFATLPWLPNELLGRPTPDAETGISRLIGTTTFTFDPFVGGGAWEAHRPGKGTIGPFVTASDITRDKPLLVHFGDNENSALLEFDAIAEAHDIIDIDVTYLYVNSEGEVVVDDEGNAVIVIVFATPSAFSAYFTTSWQTANWPEMRKSWRRPRYIMRNPPSDVSIRIESFRDYGEGEAARAGVVTLVASGGAYWREDGAAAPEGDGFDWDDGTMWSAGITGARIVRGPSFGHARALQLRFSTAPDALGRSWGIDGAIMKYVNRRFTT